MKFSKRLSIVLSAVVLTAGLQSAAKADKWTIQTSMPAGSFIFKHLDSWTPKLKALTEGRIDIQLVGGGAVVPHTQTIDAVGQDILQGDYTATVYFGGRDKAFAVLGDLISAYDSVWQQFAYCYQGGGLAMFQKVFDKYTDSTVKVVGCSPYARESFTSTIPIRSVADLKGVKIRSPEGLAAEVFKRAGANPVGLPASEVITSLQKGVIQAADYSSYTEDKSVGNHDIAKYPIYPGIHSMPTLQLTVNQARYDKLSEADKIAIDLWYRAQVVDLMQQLELSDKELVAKDKASGAVTIIDWPQAERDKLRKIAEGAWKAYAASSPLATEAYESITAYLKRAGML
jgi:TRAP-type mannitol/chloroaromatic compound transport system substrate-binding protein